MIRDLRIRRSIQFLLVCVVAGTTLIVTQSLRQAHGQPETFRVGEALDIVPASSEPHTVVFFVRSSCAACEQAKILFSMIVGIARTSRCRSVVASRQLEYKYASDIGVRATDVLRLASVPEKLPFTPTLLVIDTSRRVEYVFVGIPGQDQLEALRHILAQ